jgi:hypothetical protein
MSSTLNSLRITLDSWKPRWSRARRRSREPSRYTERTNVWIRSSTSIRRRLKGWKKRWKLYGARKIGSRRDINSCRLRHRHWPRNFNRPRKTMGLGAAMKGHARPALKRLKKRKGWLRRWKSWKDASLQLQRKMESMER